MGWRRVAEEELPTLKPQTRQMLQAYADGVNTYLRGRSPRRGRRRVLDPRASACPRAEIEEWAPLDSLTWLKAMAWDLKGNYDDELARARLSGRLTPAQINQIYPGYDFEAHPAILAPEEWSPALRATTTPARRCRPRSPRTVPGGTASATACRRARPRTGITSASAAVAPTPRSHARAAAPSPAPARARRGHRVELVGGLRVAHDDGQAAARQRPAPRREPARHLDPEQPAAAASVSAACPLDVSGFSFAGVPGVVIGHNADIAWGFTNLGPDVTDFYLERVVGDTYLRDGDWEPVTTREEVIKVAGGADQRITVRSTVHGPVMSDVVDEIDDAGGRAPTAQEGDETESYAVSLAWTGLHPRPHGRRDPRPQPRDRLRRVP